MNTIPTTSDVLANVHALSITHVNGDVLSMQSAEKAQHEATRRLLIGMLIKHEGDSKLAEMLRCMRRAEITHRVNMSDDDLDDADQARCDMVELCEEISDELFKEINNAR